MTEKNRSPQRRFDSSTLDPDGELEDLPLEPLPPEVPVVSRPEGQKIGPVVLLPVGKIDEPVLRNVQAAIQSTFNREVIIGALLPVPKYAFNPSRAQYHSAAILKRVEATKEQGWDSAIGIVDVDLFVPEVPFIFGEADRSTRAAIISLSRLRPDIGSPDSKLEVLCRRLRSEIVHQMGLIRGLAHCPNNRCVMFLSTTIQDTDKKGAQFCANCRKRLSLES